MRKNGDQLAYLGQFYVWVRYVFELQILEDVIESSQVIRYQLMHLGRLLIDLNQERGKSAFCNINH